MSVRVVLLAVCSILFPERSLFAQYGWGLSVGAHISEFNVAMPKDEYGAKGSAEGHGGMSFAVQCIMPDTVGVVWRAFELHYAQRSVSARTIYAYKVGSAATMYDVLYGSLSLGYLPRLALEHRRLWWAVIGLRVATPIVVQGSGYREVSGGLAGPPNYYSYTTFHDRASFSSILGTEARLVLALERSVPIGGGRSVCFEAGLDAGFLGQQANYSGALTSTDVFMRIAYRIRGVH